MPETPTAAKFLERAFLFTIVCHGFAMVFMLAFLMPGMPGSGDIHTQMEYLAVHPWLWRIGWLPWQLTALSDLILGIALVRTPWIPKRFALFAVVFTLIAMVFEQPNEVAWMTTGVDLAQKGLVEPYENFRDSAFAQLGYWAASFYSLAAIAWSFALVRGNCWNRFLTYLSVATWGLMLAINAAPLVFPSFPVTLVSGGNALGFCLMMVWFFTAGELIYRRSRTAEAWGRQATWRSPYPGLLGRALDLVGNSWLLRGFGELIGSPPIRSNIEEVIFINYLVPWDRLSHLAPAGTHIQSTGMNSDMSMLTVLVFRHGHFGPTFLGPIRKLMPSPIQSNWRIYVVDADKGKFGVSFVTTTLSNPISSLVARIFAEGMPMHIPKSSSIVQEHDGILTVCLEKGASSAPDLKAKFTKTEKFSLPSSWTPSFSLHGDVRDYVIPQNEVYSYQPCNNRLTIQSIELGLDPSQCEPIEGTVLSATLRELVGDAEPCAFLARNVQFDFLSQSTRSLSK